MPNLKYFWSNDILSKKVYVSPLETGKNSATTLYSEATKTGFFFDETKTPKKVKPKR